MEFQRTDAPLFGLPKVEGAIGEGGIRDHGHLDFHPLPQTKVSKAIRVHSLWCLPYHPGQTIQMVPDDPDEVEGIVRKLV